MHWSTHNSNLYLGTFQNIETNSEEFILLFRSSLISCYCCLLAMKLFMIDDLVLSVFIRRKLRKSTATVLWMQPFLQKSKKVISHELVESGSTLKVLNVVWSLLTSKMFYYLEIWQLSIGILHVPQLEPQPFSMKFSYFLY